LATISEGLEGTDIEAVSDAVALDRRLSPLVDGTIIRPGILSYLRAGTGFGGSCLPKDVAALARLSHDMGRPSAMLDAVLTANSDRPKQLLALTRARLGTLNDRKISLLGLAFKPGTDDTRASVAFEIAEQLHAEGATVTAFDPLVKTLPPAFAVPIDLAPSAEAALEDADAALVVTAWPQFATLDWVTLPDRMRRPLVVDGRNFLRHHDLPQRIEYVPIGVNPADHSGQPDRHE
ncbi:MAG: UDP binding domain-containing protein, partial [Paracoccaceae bacterium]